MSILESLSSFLENLEELLPAIDALPLSPELDKVRKKAEAILFLLKAVV